MSDVYSRNMMRVAVAKILQTIGWNSVNSTPMEILTDILVSYVSQLATSVHDYANEFGCTEPSLDHLALTFRDCHINLPDLEEYVSFIDFVPAPTNVPKYPVAKENNLNFLKPGSKEVITRPVHVHEHLPPMLPVPEEPEIDTPPSNPVDIIDIETTPPVFKRPADVGDAFKRPIYGDEAGRPTREISSVMMTTSGFISPAREGKLPEAKSPVQPHEAPPPLVDDPPLEPISSLLSDKSASNAAPPPPPSSTFDNMLQKSRPGFPRKIDRLDRKKFSKELFKPDASTTQVVPKKVEKLKKPKGMKAKKEMEDGATLIASPKKTMPKSPSTKASKALAAARLKTEKLNTTITPIPPNDKIDKLFSEPDKKKVNILRKISNVRNDKECKLGKAVELKQENIDIVDEIIKADVKTTDAATVEKTTEKMYFDDDSPPGTPSTPKTPEMVAHQSPALPMAKEKRREKEKSKKKAAKVSSPAVDLSFADLERPKTPEAHVPPPPPPSTLPPTITPANFAQFPHFGPFFGGPGLIPSQLPLLALNPFAPNVQMPPYPFPPVPTLKPPPEPARMKRKAPLVDEVDLTASTEDIPAKMSRVDGGVKKKKDKKDKGKKKNKKDKLKSKEEKKRLKEEKRDKAKKEKKEKRKDKNRDNGNLKLTLKFANDPPVKSEVPEKKLNIKPIIKREREDSPPVEVKREMSPELARISALVTGQPKPKLSPAAPINLVPRDSLHLQSKKAVFKPNVKNSCSSEYNVLPTVVPERTGQSKYIDHDGNEVWICPACGRQDDGSPMIGCDDCDAWYHWVCVGIQVPPDENENWYCRQCIIKKEEVMHSEKKKKRKKREKKDH